jgi:hypothetical protein
MPSSLLRLAAALLYLAGALSDGDKSIVDPVMKHDAKQCGQYLCPSHPSAAEAYIMSGCEGDFSANSAPLDLAAREATAPQETGVSTSVLLTLSGSCGVAALIAGFVAGKRQ